MAEKRHVAIHFTDRTKVTLKVPEQAGDDPGRAPFIQGKESS